MKTQNHPQNVCQLLLLAAAAMTLLLAPTTRAASGTWTNDASDVWSAGTNWLGGTFADGADATADFSTINITGDRTVTLDSARSAGTLRFSDTTSGQNWILNSSGGSALTLAVSSGTPTIAVTNTATISAPLAGTSGLTKTGNGTLILDGANTYSGATTVSQGTLKLQPSTAVLHLTFNNAAGSSSGSVITNTGTGGLALNGVIVGSGATIVSGGKFGNALSINGIGGSVATNIVRLSSKVLNTDANTNWTVAYWVKTSTAGAVIMYQGDGTWSSSGQTTYLLNATSYSSAGTKAGAVRWAGGFLTGTAALNNNAWHHIALVDNAGTETIYVDGNVDAVTSTMSNPLASNANQLWIGGSPDTDAGAVKLNGLIDEVYMFDRALNRTEVQALVNSNNPQSPTAPVLPVTTPVSVAAGAAFDLGGLTQTINSLAGAGNVTNTASGTAMLVVSNNTGSTTTFSGSIGDTSLANALSFVQTGGATNIFSGANTYRGATVLNGGALFVNGSLGSGAVTNGAWLGGNGTLGGALTVKSGGTLSPGTGVGQLTVNSSVTLASGSATFMEISKSPKTNDQLIASGALNYGGTLVVTNLAGTLAGGDSFALFQAGSFNGTFASTSLPVLVAGLSWNTASLSCGILSVVQTAPTNLAWAVSGTNLSLSWPGDHLGWRLLVQTNNLAGGVSQNTNDWKTVYNSQQTNRIVLPVAPALTAEFYRLVYP
jgi:autotransporter-associated beta strand protein